MKHKKSNARSIIALFTLGLLLTTVVGLPSPVPNAGALQNPCPLVPEDIFINFPHVPFNPPSVPINTYDCPPISVPFESLYENKIVNVGYPYLTDQGEWACYYPFDFTLITLIPESRLGLEVLRSAEFENRLTEDLAACVTNVKEVIDESELPIGGVYPMEHYLVWNQAEAVWFPLHSDYYDDPWGPFGQGQLVIFHDPPSTDEVTIDQVYKLSPFGSGDFCGTVQTPYECSSREEESITAARHIVTGDYWNRDPQIHYPECIDLIACIFMNSDLTSFNIETEVGHNHFSGSHCFTTFTYGIGLFQPGDEGFKTTCSNKAIEG